MVWVTLEFIKMNICQDGSINWIPNTWYISLNIICMSYNIRRTLYAAHYTSWYTVRRTQYTVVHYMPDKTPVRVSDNANTTYLPSGSLYLFTTHHQSPQIHFHPAPNNHKHYLDFIWTWLPLLHSPDTANIDLDTGQVR